MAKHSLRFRPDIEGLRAVAVLLVVACHAGIPWCSGGFIGVDVFFVISGNLITGLLLRELRETKRVDLPSFYARRARRLLPALLLVLFTTLAAGLFVQAPQELAPTARAARATALYVSNIFFDHNAADYFASDVQSNPLLHTWSLGVEEQFYLFWPILLKVGLRAGSSPRQLVGLLSAVTLASLGFCLWATFHIPTAAFYELPARAWEFGMGGLLATVSTPRRGQKPWMVLGWLGLAAILLPAFFIADGSDFPGWLAIIPAAGTVAVLAAGQALPGRGVCVVLEGRPMQYMGTRSYSWYLWHWPLIVFSAAIVPSISLTSKVLVAAAALGAAGLTYRFLEAPIRHNQRLISRTRLSLVLAGVTAVVAGAIAWLLVPVANGMAHKAVVAPITAAVADIADLPRRDCVSLGQSTEALTCTFGDTQSSTAVVLFGDSHAIEWFDAINRVARGEHWRLVTMVKSGCAAGELPDASIARTRACHAWRVNALRAIGTLRPSLVFVASFTEWFGRVNNRRSDPRLEHLTHGIRATLEWLSRAGLRVVLLRDTPFPPFDVPTCLARTALHRWLPQHTCEFYRADALSPSVFAAQTAAAADLPRVYLLDLTDQICGGSVCPASVRGLIVYRDANHLTGGFAGTLAPVFATRLSTIVATAAAQPEPDASRSVP